MVFLESSSHLITEFSASNGDSVENHGTLFLLILLCYLILLCAETKHLRRHPWFQYMTWEVQIGVFSFQITFRCQLNSPFISRRIWNTKDLQLISVTLCTGWRRYTNVVCKYHYTAKSIKIRMIRSNFEIMGFRVEIIVLITLICTHKFVDCYNLFTSLNSLAFHPFKNKINASCPISCAIGRLEYSRWKLYLTICAGACVCLCVCARSRAGVWCVGMRACVLVCACVLACVRVCVYWVGIKLAYLLWNVSMSQIYLDAWLGLSSNILRALSSSTISKKF